MVVCLFLAREDNYIIFAIFTLLGVAGIFFLALIQPTRKVSWGQRKGDGCYGDGCYGDGGEVMTEVYLCLVVQLAITKPNINADSDR